VPICSHTPPLDYQNYGKGFVDKHCVGCHSSLLPESHRMGAPLGVDLDTYQFIIDWADRIEARATGSSPSMPPGGGPSEQELANLAEWLECSVLPNVERMGEASQ
jgi:uncharacterized membrane protein